ncbi:MAG: hypothetical protein NTU95_10750 [Methanothrix sp.]|nr:hypothetical protein [Methanothrix sp.]
MNKTIVVLCLMLVTLFGIASAVSDNEILQFAKGVVAGDSSIKGTVILIKNDTLVANYFLSEYDSRDPDMLVSKAEWVMDAMVKVIQEYPDRFTAVHAGVLNDQKLLASDSLWLNGGY